LTGRQKSSWKNTVLFKNKRSNDAAAWTVAVVMQNHHLKGDMDSISWKNLS